MSPGPGSDRGVQRRNGSPGPGTDRGTQRRNGSPGLSFGPSKSSGQSSKGHGASPSHLESPVSRFAEKGTQADGKEHTSPSSFERYIVPNLQHLIQEVDAASEMDRKKKLAFKSVQYQCVDGLAAAFDNVAHHPIVTLRSPEPSPQLRTRDTSQVACVPSASPVSASRSPLTTNRETCYNYPKVPALAIAEAIAASAEYTPTVSTAGHDFSSKSTAEDTEEEIVLGLSPVARSPGETLFHHRG